MKLQILDVPTAYVTEVREAVAVTMYHSGGADVKQEHRRRRHAHLFLMV